MPVADFVIALFVVLLEALVFLAALRPQVVVTGRVVQSAKCGVIRLAIQNFEPRALHGPIVLTLRHGVDWKSSVTKAVVYAGPSARVSCSKMEAWSLELVADELRGLRTWVIEIYYNGFASTRVRGALKVPRHQSLRVPGRAVAATQLSYVEVPFDIGESSTPPGRVESIKRSVFALWMALLGRYSEHLVADAPQSIRPFRVRQPEFRPRDFWVLLLAVVTNSVAYFYLRSQIFGRAPRVSSLADLLSLFSSSTSDLSYKAIESGLAFPVAVVVASGVLVALQYILLKPARTEIVQGYLDGIDVELIKPTDGSND